MISFYWSFSDNDLVLLFVKTINSKITNVNKLTLKPGYISDIITGKN